MAHVCKNPFNQIDYMFSLVPTLLIRYQSRKNRREKQLVNGFSGACYRLHAANRIKTKANFVLFAYRHSMIPLLSAIRCETSVRMEKTIKVFGDNEMEMTIK